jgi:hypothetical protein
MPKTLRRLPTSSLPAIFWHFPSLNLDLICVDPQFHSVAIADIGNLLRYDFDQ